MIERHWKRLLLLTACLTLAACGKSSPVPISSPIPTYEKSIVDPIYQSQGGGDPRSTGYWLIWNSCAEDNKAEVASANGGWEAGWIILDDLLQDPGILIGELRVETCEQGVYLLHGMDIAGQEKEDDDSYTLASQLLVAQLNLAVGTEYCPAIEEAIQAG